MTISNPIRKLKVKIRDPKLHWPQYTNMSAPRFYVYIYARIPIGRPTVGLLVVRKVFAGEETLFLNIIILNFDLYAFQDWQQLHAASLIGLLPAIINL